MREVEFNELDGREADRVAIEVEFKLGGKRAEDVEGVGLGPAWSVWVVTTVEIPLKAVVSTVV